TRRERVRRDMGPPENGTRLSLKCNVADLTKGVKQKPQRTHKNAEKNQSAALTVLCCPAQPKCRNLERNQLLHDPGGARPSRRIARQQPLDEMGKRIGQVGHAQAKVARPRGL